MKKHIAWLLALTLLLALLPAWHTEAEEGTSVRVLLGTEGASKVEVAVTGTYSVGDTTFTGGTLTASIKNGTITVSHSEKETLATSKTAVRVVRAETDRDAAYLTLTNTGHNAKLTYLGDLIFHNADGTMEVINDVGIREYLYGVVSGEVTNSSNEELLKAEAVCAKGFALVEVNARKAKSFDVYDTTTSQLYYGYKAGDTNVIAAVDEVWQNTLLYQGNLVKTYYCTANGGQAITPQIHWGGGDNAGAYYFGYDPFDLGANSKNVILNVNGANPSAMDGKVYDYFLSLAEGALGEPVERIEQVVALSGVYDADKPDGTSRYPKDLAPHAESSITLNVCTKAGGYRQTICKFTLTDLNSAADIKASGKVAFTVRTGAQEWKILYGINSGHRVGLSHRGAKEMAKRGYSYVDILKFYYRGADLQDAGGRVIPCTANFSFTYEGPEPEPTPIPTEAPTPEPTSEEPTVEPTAEPTPGPTEEPTEEPTVEPSDEPTPGSTEEPTAEPTEEPTVEPTEEPTVEPTEDPTVEPTEDPTQEPTVEPTDEPTPGPTEEPTAEPTEEPTIEPTVEPTPGPTEEPTEEPTVEPTPEPTATPEPSQPQMGDVDGENGITRADALLVIRYLVGLESLTEEQLARADVNGDGKVNALDAAAILRMIP